MIFKDLNHIEHVINDAHVLHGVFNHEEKIMTFQFEHKFLVCTVDQQTFSRIKAEYIEFVLRKCQ